MCGKIQKEKHWLFVCLSWPIHPSEEKSAVKYLSALSNCNSIYSENRCTALKAVLEPCTIYKLNACYMLQKIKSGC